MGLYPLALSSFLAFGWVSSLHTDLRSKVDVRPLKWQEEGDKEQRSLWRALASLLVTTRMGVVAGKFGARKEKMSRGCFLLFLPRTRTFCLIYIHINLQVCSNIALYYRAMLLHLRSNLKTIANIWKSNCFEVSEKLLTLSERWKWTYF